MIHVIKRKPSLIVPTCNLNIGEGKAGELLCLRLAWDRVRPCLKKNKTNANKYQIWIWYIGKSMIFSVKYIYFQMKVNLKINWYINF